MMKRLFRVFSRVTSNRAQLVGCGSAMATAPLRYICLGRMGVIVFLD